MFFLNAAEFLSSCVCSFCLLVCVSESARTSSVAALRQRGSVPALQVSNLRETYQQ